MSVFVLTVLGSHFLKKKGGEKEKEGNPHLDKGRS